MKSFCACGAALTVALTAIFVASGARADEPGYTVPSLLPLPKSSINYPATNYPADSTSGSYAAPGARGRTDGYGVAPTSGSYTAARGQRPNYYDIADPADDGLPQAAGGGGEAAGDAYHDGYDHHGAYADAMTAPYGGGCATCGSNPCECAGGCWYGGLGGLIMTRDGENEFQLSSRSDDFNATVLSTRFSEMNWAGGGEVYIGRYLGECWAMEAGYWGLYPDAQQSLAFDADGTAGNGIGDLITSFDLTTLDFDDGGGPGVVNDWFDGAEMHGLRREYEIHNVELNLRRLAIGSGCGSCASQRWRASWLVGVRFFRYDENFDYFSDLSNTVITGAPDEVHYTIDVTNDFIGGQVGGDVEYLVIPRLSLSLGTKFGLYDNHIDHRSRIGSSAGPATVGAGPNAGDVWDISSEKDDVAFMGEVALAMHYQISDRWSARLGYRALAVTGIAFPSAQVPNNFEDVYGVAQIDSNGSMILHGAFVGVEYNY